MSATKGARKALVLVGILLNIPWIMVVAEARCKVVLPNDFVVGMALFTILCIGIICVESNRWEDR